MDLPVKPGWIRMTFTTNGWTHVKPHTCWIRTLAVAGMASLMIACPRQPGENRGPAPVFEVLRRDITRVCREDGTLMAARFYEIRPEVDNERLLEITVAEGAAVRKGDVLGRIDTARIDGEIEVGRQRVTALRLQLELARRRRAGTDRLQAQQMVLKSEQDRRQAARMLTSGLELGAAGLATTADVEKAQAQFKAGEIEFDIARRQFDELNEFAKSGEIAELEVRLAETENMLKELNQNRDKYTITAPFDGRVMFISEAIKNINTPLADIVFRANSTPGPLMILADVATMRVMGHFYENDIALIRVGQTARITARHAPNRVFEGTVVSVSQIGRSHGRSATVAVEVAVPNPDLLLKQSLTAQIEIVVDERKQVLAVPVEFVRFEGDRANVLRIEKGDARRAVPVKTGISDNDFIEITDGLQERDRVTME